MMKQNRKLIARAAIPVALLAASIFTVLLIVSSVKTSREQMTKQTQQGLIEWGPYIQPFEDKALAVWYGKNNGEMEILQQIIPPEGEFEANGRKIAYKIPTEVKRLLLLADVHSRYHYIKKFGTDFDLMLIAGDLTLNGYIVDYEPLFRIVEKPLLWASGNHDRWQNGQNDTTAVMGRSNTFYQKVGNIGVFVLYFDDEREVNQTILDHINDEDVEHQFIVEHFPFFSTGCKGSKDAKPFSDNILEILDTHPNHIIRAVITGHDHLFNLFERNNVFFLLVSPSGHYDELYYEDFVPPRRFEGFITGPLDPVDEYCDGYENHVESFVWKGMRVKTYLDIMYDKLVYTVVNLHNDEVIRVYEQFI